MKIAPYTLGVCCAAAGLSGCGGSQVPATSVPGMTRAALIQPAARNMYINLPGQKPKGGTLHAVQVFDIVTGKLALTFDISGTPQGECVDVKGDVYIVDSQASDILEYAYGGKTPIATYPDAGASPYGCSVDPTTGDLAVTNYQVGSAAGDVAVYTSPSASPTIYTDPNILNFTYAAYDPKGNLYVDGVDKADSFRMAGLTRGGGSLTNINVNQTIGGPGNLEWYNTLNVGDSKSNVIYQVSVSGSTGKVTGKTALTGGESNLYFIGKTSVAGPSPVRTSPIKTIVISCTESDGACDKNSVATWQYPKGGSIYRRLKFSGLNDPSFIVGNQ
jgi:hypothetical protein